MRTYQGTLKDQWVDFKYWALNWIAIARFAAPRPIRVVKGMLRYPWIYDLLKANNLAKRYNVGRTGTSLLLSHMNVHHVVKCALRSLVPVVDEARNLVLLNALLPTEIFQAMGVDNFLAELPASLMPLVDQHASNKYMDLIENAGLPGDTCSYPRITAGVFEAGEFPPCTCLVSINMACEGAYASHAYFAGKLGIPAYRVDIPYHFHDDEAVAVLVEDMKGVIAFLEQVTGKQMDWAQLKTILDRHNKVNELELERWDMVASEVPPIVNENVWIPHLWAYSIDPGTKEGLDWYLETQRIIESAFRRREVPVRGMRYRTVIWNPPTFGFSHCWNWLERCWGVASLNDMETYGHFENLFIDTSTREGMMKGLAKKWCYQAMTRHTRGPAENYLTDAIGMAEQFKADFILVANHIACRSSLGMHGLLKEEARKRNIPVCFFDYELMDSRVCSRQGIRDQISRFMTTVMKATPLDASLLVLDDDTAW